ncbi:hyaluronan-binding protein 2-like isoform X2 [Siniperca chuatsi]|uniref:hyaluronan-binding protein 2-like isoform X2 n=1 Tax=Siniperca chuatsi TaxID=119488 RepID=UPI001CE116B9|nr:hyaluronan-binding protein 2-like isoform X2 [Siniperca chuatsi]
MNLKLLFFWLFLAVLLIPAELANKNHKKHQDPEHGTSEHRGHGRPEHRGHGRPEHHGHGKPEHHGHGRPEHHGHERPEHHGHGRPEHHGDRGCGQPKPGKIRGRFKDIIEDFFFKIINRTGDDDDDDDHDNDGWLFDLQKLEGQCNPNPCQNNGVCEQKSKGKFECDCPKPYKGKRCERGPKICTRGKCGRGECVLTSTFPFYECKCKEPFQPPDCTSFSVCEPNPCRNGGICIKDGNDFDCQCPSGYRGRFCHVGPGDCYVDDGESYRGNMSETDDGDECLFWNSHFILEKGVDPFNSFEDKDGLGPHNFCRNPDGDRKPWCFFRRGCKLLWDYCDVTKCPKPTDPDPTAPKPQPTEPEPTAIPKPQPTKPEPTVIPKPQPTKPEPTAIPKPQPTKPEPTAIPKPQPTKPEPTAIPKPQPTKPEPTAIPKPITTKPPTTEKPSQAPQLSSTPTSVPPISGATAPPPQFSTCGKPQPKKVITRIFGGLKVAPGAVPWQVSLQVRPKNSNQPFRHICGGVLIASCWVLTAGHCIDQTKDMQVVMGSLSLNMEEPTEQTIHVEEAILHENYRETPEAVYNDIALLRLNGTDGVCATETQFVKTACLPDGQLPDGIECTISGWGATEQSSYGSNHLLEANVLLINQKKCSEPTVYGRILDNTMFCAGHLQGGVDSCQGDSGGPLTCKPNDSHVIYGLVSWGDKCGRQNKPGVYTRVTHFLQWIKSKMQAASPKATSV